VKDFFHILNPSGSRKKQVRRFFGKNTELDFMWVERVSHPTHLETLVQWAVNEGRPRIAVWGGDGTLNRVAQCLYDLNAFGKMAVALVPVGTCNDFARKWGLPPWEKWVKQGMTRGGGEPRPIDVGMLSTRRGHRVFINNSGFGRAPRAIGRRSHPLRDIFSFTEKRLDLDWSLDGARHFETRRALLGIVFNAPYFNGGMYFDKSIEPDDNVLSAFFESPQSAGRLLWKFLQSRFGKSLADKNTFELKGQSFRIESDGDLFPQVDGETAFTGAVRSLEFSLLQDKMSLLL